MMAPAFFSRLRLFIVRHCSTKVHCVTQSHSRLPEIARSAGREKVAHGVFCVGPDVVRTIPTVGLTFWIWGQHIV